MQVAGEKITFAFQKHFVLFGWMRGQKIRTDPSNCKQDPKFKVANTLGSPGLKGLRNHSGSSSSIQNIFPNTTPYLIHSFTLHH